MFVTKYFLGFIMCVIMLLQAMLLFAEGCAMSCCAAVTVDCQLFVKSLVLFSIC